MSNYCPWMKLTSTVASATHYDILHGLLSLAL